MMTDEIVDVLIKRANRAGWDGMVVVGFITPQSATESPIPSLILRPPNPLSASQDEGAR